MTRLLLFAAPLSLVGHNIGVRSLPLPDGLLALNSSAGVELLWREDTLRVPFDVSFIHYVTQQDEASVSPESCTRRTSMAFHLLTNMLIRSCALFTVCPCPRVAHASAAGPAPSSS